MQRQGKERRSGSPWGRTYFEYDKKLKGQQKSVDMLKAQIAALEGVKIFALCVLIAGTPLEFYKLQRKNEICLSVNV